MLGSYRLPVRQIPFRKYADPCFPMSVYCRSREEADQVYQFQHFVRRIERQSVGDVVQALLSNTQLCELFGESISGVKEFYAAPYNGMKRPTVFLSW